MLQLAVDRLTYSLFGLDPEARWAASLNFFIYDSVKIFILLFVFIALIGFFRTYLSQRRIRAWLSGKGIYPYLAAALFGAVTPFCSCSSIPIFIGFITAGVPLGVAFAFLITSPLINEYLVVLMIGFFGPLVAGLYVVSGLLLGIIPGLLLERLPLRRFLVADMEPVNGRDEDQMYSGFRDRLRFGWSEAVNIVRKIWLWVLAGVAIGALIHNYVPQESIQNLLGKTGIWSVPLATLLGVPMYGSCAAIVPIAVVLFQKGLPLGTALAFMMAIVALSLPEAVMLRRVMRLQLILIFFGITISAIILTGYAFNAIGAISERPAGETLFVYPIAAVKTAVTPAQASRLNLYKPRCLVTGTCGNTDWPEGLEAPAALLRLSGEGIIGLQRIPAEAPMYGISDDFNAGEFPLLRTINSVQFLNSIPVVAYDAETATLVLVRAESGKAVMLAFHADEVRDRVFDLRLEARMTRRIRKPLLLQLMDVLGPELDAASPKAGRGQSTTAAAEYARRHPYDPASGTGMQLITDPGGAYYPEDSSAELRVIGVVTGVLKDRVIIAFEDAEVEILLEPASTLYYIDGAGTFKERGAILPAREWRLVGERIAAGAYVGDDGRLRLTALFRP